MAQIKSMRECGWHRLWWREGPRIQVETAAVVLPERPWQRPKFQMPTQLGVITEWDSGLCRAARVSDSVHVI